MRRLAFLIAAVGLSACQADKATQERELAQDAVLTSGSVIDCTDDLSDAARIVCADTDLRAMDRRVAELWAQVAEVTGRPNTLRRRHADWIAERDSGEMDWDTGDRRPRTSSELREFHQAYFDTLSEELRFAEALPDTSPVAALAGGCIGAALSNCTASSGGYVNGPGGQRLAWQIQRGSTDYAGVTEGLVLFAIDGDLLRPIGWSFDAVQLEAPTIFEYDGAVFVAAKGSQAGTGSGNADILYRMDGQHWTEIEIESWKSALAEALPEGLGVWKGVDYLWPEMMALTSLWRDADANCCPSGGQAMIDLRVEGTTLRFVAVNLTDGGR